MDKIQSAQNQQPTNAKGAEALVATMKMIFIAFRLLVIVLFACYFLSGIFFVNPDKKSFIVRFGALVKKAGSTRVYEAGQWNWAWPKPIDEIIHVPVKQARSLNIDSFWYHENALAEKDKDGKYVMLNEGVIKLADPKKYNEEIEKLNDRTIEIEIKKISRIEFEGVKMEGSDNLFSLFEFVIE